MIIKIVLFVIFLLLAIFIVLQKGASRGGRGIVLVMLATGAFLVWEPERANALAHPLGVGRGADLLLYLWIVITLAVILLLYLKLVEMNRMLTELARQLTLSRPIRPSAADAATQQRAAGTPARHQQRPDIPGGS